MNYRWIQNVATFDLWFNTRKNKSFWVTLLVDRSIDVIQAIESPKLGFKKMMNAPNKVWTHNLFNHIPRHLTIKPSLHVMTKNDITKCINTYFKQLKIYIIDWFNCFLGLLYIKLCNSFNSKNVNHIYLNTR